MTEVKKKARQIEILLLFLGRLGINIKGIYKEDAERIAIQFYLDQHSSGLKVIQPLEYQAVLARLSEVQPQ